MKLIKNQLSYIDKIYLYVKDLFESKYQLLINEKKVEIKKLKSPKAVIDYSQTINDVYENLEDYNLEKERGVLKCLMIWYQIWNLIKIKSYYYRIVFKEEGNLIFHFLYIIIWFLSASKCKNKCNTLFYNENSWKNRTSAISVK